MKLSKLDQIFMELGDTEDAELLRKALEDEQVGHKDLAAVLSSRGWAIDESSIRRWRAKT